MTGLNLENFLRLIQSDFAAWGSLAALSLIVLSAAWTGVRARKILRRCLAFSLLIHVGLIGAGGHTDWGRRLLVPWEPEAEERLEEGIQRIAVVEETGARDTGEEAGGSEGEGRVAPVPMASWDRPAGNQTLMAMAAVAPLLRPEGVGELQGGLNRVEMEKTELVASELPVVPVGVVGEDRSLEEAGGETSGLVTPAAGAEAAEGELPEISIPGRPSMRAADVREGARQTAGIPRPGPSAKAGAGRGLGVAGAGVAVGAGVVSGLVSGMSGLPGELEREGSGDISRLPEEPGRPAGLLEGDAPGIGAVGGGERRELERAPELAMPGRGPRGAPLLAARERDLGLRRPPRAGLEAEAGGLGRAMGGAALLPEALSGSAPARALPAVPEVYRSRMDPNRSRSAQRLGASVKSEESVERALDWLARHQDEDGRWDGAIGRDSEGRAVPGDDDFTVHCPPGEVCFGPCHYWEADTAMTGLALLGYLGAGYTHVEGKHATTVRAGLDYLLRSQKPDGDLRGKSRAVGMYCHSMAALALCEAFALTGDSRLREPAVQSVDFLVKSRARDGMSWRYAPEAPVGDTSILGWVILVLKSAREVGFAIPSAVASGSERWLRLVSSGRSAGLAVYQPGQEVTPTMTAEAWVCRQFLGVGGPGAASEEAAAYILRHPPSEEFNIYYLYYATIGMYQLGGENWRRWNALVRDEVVNRQRKEGHQAGSWDPDESRWGRYGGRIYTTALATLTLEVYYRYLRLYDSPGIPSE